MVVPVPFHRMREILFKRGLDVARLSIATIDREWPEFWWDSSDYPKYFIFFSRHSVECLV
jgi:hypothetical protein